MASASLRDAIRSTSTAFLTTKISRVWRLALAGCTDERRQVQRQASAAGGAAGILGGSERGVWHGAADRRLSRAPDDAAWRRPAGFPLAGFVPAKGTYRRAG